VEAGKKTAPVKHLYEAFFYVLEGYGSTVVTLPGGESRTFEWEPKSLFAVPLNCTYQIFNGSGQNRARLSCTNDAPLTINLYHNVGFVFDNPYEFPERTGAEKHFEGGGEHYTYNRGGNKMSTQNVWETNFVHDLTSFKLYDLEARGRGSRNVAFILADGTMHAHTSEIPAGRYKKAHRHAAGTHVHAVDGEGYSLLWYEGDSEFKELPWRHGIMYTPPFWMFHQHFNTGARPARYLACSLGSRRYPFIALRRRSAEGGGMVSIQQGGRQIEYEDQDPRIHRKWLEALKLTKVASDMGDVFDEAAILRLPESELTGVIRQPASIGPAV
jgi:oxalate decarboxylase/phosphoglucose isomerase-like protein (cupin superfamily)